MTKPVEVVEAYACARCGKVFGKLPNKWMMECKTAAQRKEYREQSKRFAEMCCACPKCGEKCDRYFGTNDKYCSKCKNESQWEFATEQLAKAINAYEGVAITQGREDPKLEERMALHVDNRRRRRGGMKT